MISRTYQQYIELIDHAEATIGIRKGLESMERGEGIPAEQAFEIIRIKHKIPRSKQCSEDNTKE